jgi:hypothetical protein
MAIQREHIYVLGHVQPWRGSIPHVSIYFLLMQPNLILDGIIFVIKFKMLGKGQSDPHFFYYDGKFFCFFLMN